MTGMTQAGRACQTPHHPGSGSAVAHTTQSPARLTGCASRGWWHQRSSFRRRHASNGSAVFGYTFSSLRRVLQRATTFEQQDTVQISGIVRDSRRATAILLFRLRFPHARNHHPTAHAPATTRRHAAGREGVVLAPEPYSENIVSHAAACEAPPPNETGLKYGSKLLAERRHDRGTDPAA